MRGQAVLPVHQLATWRGKFKESYPGTDEAQFVDGVRRSLSTGDFLLLIVGDGIRFGAEALVTFLEQYGNLRISDSLLLRLRFTDFPMVPH